MTTRLASLGLFFSGIAVLSQPLPFFSQSRNWSWNRFGTPAQSVQLRPPIYPSEYVADGKLTLSLRTYVELVLENNTDISLARLQVQSPTNAITRALAAFDPVLQGSYTRRRSNQPTTSTLQGAATLQSLSEPFGLSFQQFLSTGTNLNVGLNTERDSTNSSYSTLNPYMSTNLGLQIDHALLRNRGGNMLKRIVLIARSNLIVSKYQLRDQLGSLIASAENAYWDVVQARENVSLQSKLLELRRAALERTRKRIIAGALLQLELYQPASDFASSRLALIQAKQTLTRAENILRQQIGADLVPSVRSLPIQLTEPIAIPTSPPLDREAIINSALARRPDRMAASATISTDDLNVRNAIEGLRPNLSLTGSYVAQGVGGVYKPYNGTMGNGAPSGEAQGGLSNALGQLFGMRFPVYSVGLTLKLPLRDRMAAADLAEAELHKRQDSLQIRKLEQSIRLQVANAIDDLETLEAALQEATAAREYAEKRFLAEQKKYELGATQLFFLLDSQTSLNQAENEVLRELISYRRALVNLDLVTGELLLRRAIMLD